MLRKSTLLIGLMTLVFGLMVNQSYVHTFSGGAPDGRSGSPIDGQSCGGCHTGNVNPGSANAMIVITDSGGSPVTNYTPGDTYNITFSSGTNMSNRFGFTMAAESAGSKEGTFISGAGSSNLGSGNIGHSGTSATGSWSFQWTAPATDVGDITFYGVINDTDGSFGTTGDAIYLNEFVLAAPLPECELSNLVITPPVCTGTGSQYDLDVAFDVANPGTSNMYNVSVAGMTYGPFTYAAGTAQTQTIMDPAWVGDLEVGVPVIITDADVPASTGCDLVINEVLADPPASTDVNGDGTASTTEDEFVEIVNNGSAAIDITGWTLADGFGVRHTFPATTSIPAGGSVVVFGNIQAGGASCCGSAIVQDASGGSLGLNNSNDSVTLTDDLGVECTSMSYGGEGGNNQSLSLDPDQTGTTYAQHDTDLGQGPYSPGTQADGSAFVAGSPVAACEVTGDFTEPDCSCGITSVSAGTVTCNGNDSEFTVSFDVANGSGDYEVVDPSNNVIGSITAAAGTGSALSITATVTNTSGGTLMVNVRDTNEPTCAGTAVMVTLGDCATCVLANVAATAPICNGTDSEFNVIFDITNGSGDYEVFDVNTTSVLNSIGAGPTTGTSLFMQISVASLLGGSVTLNVRDTNNPSCAGTQIEVTLEVCCDPDADPGTCDVVNGGPIPRLSGSAVIPIEFGEFADATQSGANVPTGYTSEFILCSDATCSTIIATSATGDFDNLGAISNAPDTYFVGHVIYPIGTGALDPCAEISIAADQVEFRPAPVCDLTNLVITPPVCSGNGEEYDLDIAFDIANPGVSNMYNVTINGTLYGPFAYVAGTAQTQTIIDPSLLGNLETSVPVVVSDADAGGACDLVINEILADPPGSTDVNGDGTASTTEDEFVEIVNNGSTAIDITGWTISDSGSIRHTFPATTSIPAGGSVVVFGNIQAGGASCCGSAIVQDASSGSLGLNNGGDSVILADDLGVECSSMTYGGEGGDNQSLSLDPDQTGNTYSQHSSDLGQGDYSPGTQADGSAFAAGLAAPPCEATATFDEPDCSTPVVECAISGIQITGTCTGTCSFYEIDLTFTVADATIGDTYYVFIENNAYGPYTYTTTDGQESVTVSGPGLVGDLENQTLIIGNVVINEFLADPGTADDVNGDGTANTSQDEFVEIVNTTGSTIDISGWELFDSGSSPRHVFPTGTILPPGGSVVVFGLISGAPVCCTNATFVQTASSGSLGLNNGGDDVVLNDAIGTTVDSHTYSTSCSDQSFVRDPEYTGAFVCHETSSTSGGSSFSPGSTSAGAAFAASQCAGEQAFVEPDCPVACETGTVIISEITPDAGTNDGIGGEWLELTNPGADPVDISGWVLTDGDITIVFPDGTIIPAGGFYTVGTNQNVDCAVCDYPGYAFDLDLGTYSGVSGFSGNLAIENGCMQESPSFNFTLAEQIALFNTCSSITDPVYAIATGGLTGSNTIEYPDNVGGFTGDICQAGAFGDAGTLPDPAANAAFYDDIIDPDVYGNSNACTGSYSLVDGVWIWDDTPTPSNANDSDSYTLAISYTTAAGVVSQTYEFNGLYNIDDPSLVSPEIPTSITVCEGSTIDVTFTQIEPVSQNLAPGMPPSGGDYGSGGSNGNIPSNYGSGIAATGDASPSDLLTPYTSQTFTANGTVDIRIREMGISNATPPGESLNGACDDILNGSWLALDCVLDYSIDVVVESCDVSCPDITDGTLNFDATNYCSGDDITVCVDYALNGREYSAYPVSFTYDNGATFFEGTYDAGAETVCYTFTGAEAITNTTCGATQLDFSAQITALVDDCAVDAQAVSSTNVYPDLTPLTSAAVDLSGCTVTLTACEGATVSYDPGTGVVNTSVPASGTIEVGFSVGDSGSLTFAVSDPAAPATCAGPIQVSENYDCTTDPCFGFLPPTVTNVSECEGDDMTITPTGGGFGAAVTYNFFEDNAGAQGTAIAAAQSVASYDPATILANSPETYWVSATDGTCESESVMVTVTVLDCSDPCATFAAPTVSNIDVCVGDDTTITPADGGFGASTGQSFTWDFEGEVLTGVATDGTTAASDAAAGAGLGSVSFPGGNGTTDSYSANSWDEADQAAAETAGDYFEFCITGTSLDLDNITFEERASNTGPSNYDIQLSVDAGAYASVGSGLPVGSENWGTVSQAISVSGASSACVRIFGWGASGGGGTWRFDNVVISGGAGAPVTYNFYDIDPALGGATLLAGPASDYDPAASTSVWVTATDGVCESVAVEVVVTISDAPEATVTGTATLCNVAGGANPTSITLDDLVTAGPTNGTGAWTDESLATVTSFDGAAAGSGVYNFTYTVTPTAGSTCDPATYPLTITVQDCSVGDPCSTFAAPTVSNIDVCAGDDTTITPVDGGFGASTGQSFTWDFEGEVLTGVATDANTAAVDAAAGAGLGSVSFPGGNGTTDSYSANNWNEADLAAAEAAGDYFEFCMTGTSLELDNITFDERASNTGPGSYDIQLSVDAGAYASVGSGSPAGSENWSTINQAISVSGATSACVRIFGWGASGGGGTWRFDNVVISGGAGAPVTYNFYDIDPALGGATLLAGPAVDYDPAASTSIWVTATDGVCESTAVEVVVTINDAPEATVTGTAILCNVTGGANPTTITLDDLVTAGPTNGTGEWTDESLAVVTSFDGEAAGVGVYNFTYTVTPTAGSPCTPVTYPLAITVQNCDSDPCSAFAAPQVENIDLCETGSTEIIPSGGGSAGSTAQSFTWDFEGELKAGVAADLANTNALDAAIGAGNAGESFPGGNGTTDAYSANNWDEADQAAAEATDDYFEFCVAATNGTLNLDNISFEERASNSGPSDYSIQVSIDGGAFASVAIASTATSTAGSPTWSSISEALAISGATTACVRLYAWGGSGATGTWRLDNVVLSGPASGAISYNFYDADPNPGPANLLATGATFDPAAEGTYYITAFDSDCESDATEVTITIHDPLTATVTTSASLCNATGGVNPTSIVLNDLVTDGPTNGTGVWTNSAGDVVTDFDATVVIVNDYTFTYTVTPTDINSTCPELVFNAVIAVQDCTGGDPCEDYTAPTAEAVFACSGGDTEIIPSGGGFPLTGTPQSFTYDFDGEVVTGVASDANTTALDASTGSGVGTASFPGGNGSSDAYSNTGWSEAGLDADDYFEFCVNDSPGGSGLTLDNLTFDERASNSGPASYEVQVSVDAGAFTTVSSGSTAGMGLWSTGISQSLSISGATTVCVRIFGFGATSSGGTWRLDNVIISGGSGASISYNYYDIDPGLGGATLLSTGTSYDPGASGTYWVTAIGGGCESTAIEVDVTIFDDIVGPNTVSGTCDTPASIETTLDATYTVNYTTGSGPTSGTGTSFDVPGASAGTVTWTISQAGAPPECSELILLPVPFECAEIPCSMDATATPGDCDGDTYDLDLEIDIINPEYSDFIVIVDGVTYGPFAWDISGDMMAQTISGLTGTGGTISFEVLDFGGWTINEINADPSALTGDANGDGTSDPSQDEFVEIVNNTGADQDISGWTINDGSDTNGVEHTFSTGTVIPNGCSVLVFGGGTPTGTFGSAVVTTSSNGTLSLNNGGDDVTFADDLGNTMAEVLNYGGADGGQDQSVVFDGTGYDLHSNVQPGIFTSAGTATDGSTFAGCEATITNCSATGSYTAPTCTDCPNPPTAGFLYSGTFCINGTDTSVDPIFDPGATSGIFSVSPTGLTVDSSTGTIDLTTSSSGTYTISNTIPAAGSCPEVVSDFIFNFFAAPIVDAGEDETTCEGFAVNLFASGGSSFLWSTSETSQLITVSPTVETTYTVTVSDGNCSATDEVTVFVTNLSNAGLNDNASVCNSSAGGGDTTIDLDDLLSDGVDPGIFSPTGGAPELADGNIFDGAGLPISSAYQYLYTVLGNSPCPDDISAFTIFITDCISCPDPPVADFSYDGPYCTNGSQTTANPTLAAGATAGLFTATPAGLSINAATGSIDLTSSSVGVYSVVNLISAADGCPQVSASTIVEISEAPTADAGDDETICEGTSVTLTASGGTSYVWSTAETTASITVSPSSDMSYSVTVSDNDCSDSDEVMVFVSTNVNAGFDNSDNTCNSSDAGGSTTVDLDDLLSAGVDAGNFTAVGAAPALGAGNVFDGTGLADGTSYQYTYSVAGNSPCLDDEATFTITVIDCGICPNPPTAGFSYGGPYCNEGTTSSVSPTLFPGTTSGSFSSTPTGLSIDASGTVDVTNSLPGIYTVTNTVAASGGCPEVSAVGGIEITSAPTAEAGDDQTICIGSSVTLTATGGASYEWSNGGDSDMITVSPLVTTSYTVTVTENGCTSVDQVTVNVNSSASAGDDNSASLCNAAAEGASSLDLDNLLSAGVSGGIWTTSAGNPALDGDNAFDAEGLTAGSSFVYTYTVTSDAPCPSDQASFTITITDCATCPNPPSAGFSYGGPYCADDALGTAFATLDAGASTGTFSSTIGLDIDAATGDVAISSSTPGTYTVTNLVAASGDCPEASAIASITIDALVSADAGDDEAICLGESVTLTASGGGTYLWSTDETSSSITVSPSETTSFSVTVTNGACSSTDDVTVNVEDGPFAGADNSATLCNDSAEGNTTIDLDDLLAADADSGSWTASAGAPAPDADNVVDVSGIADGSAFDYTYTVLGTDNCPDDSAVITISVDDCFVPEPSCDIATLGAGIPSSFCSDNTMLTASINLAGGNGSTSSVTWSLNGSGSSVTGPNFSFDVGAPSSCGSSVYSLTATVTCGLDGSITTINAGTAILYHVPVEGVDFTLPSGCDGILTNVCSGAVVNYTVNGTSVPSAPTDLSHNDEVGYSVGLVGAPDACFAEGSFTIDCPVTGCPDLDYAPGAEASITICSGESADFAVSLTNGDLADVMWSNGETGSSASSGVLTNAGCDPLTETYTASIAEGAVAGCPSDAISFTVTILPDPATSVVVSTDGCTVSAMACPDAEITYSVNGGDGIEGSTYTAGPGETSSISFTISNDCGSFNINESISCAGAPLASLGSFVWIDSNLDGEFNEGETPLEGVEVTLYTADGTPVETLFTDDEGFYLFDNLDPGDYYVEFSTPTGFSPTIPNQGSDSSDSDIDPTGQSNVVSLSEGQNDLSVWAGYVEQPLECEPEAGSVILDQDYYCAEGEVSISGSGYNMEAGYVQAYILTTGSDYTIAAISETGYFGELEAGLYCAHAINYQFADAPAIPAIGSSALALLDDSACFDIEGLENCQEIRVISEIQIDGVAYCDPLVGGAYFVDLFITGGFPDFANFGSYSINFPPNSVNWNAEMGYATTTIGPIPNTAVLTVDVDGDGLGCEGGPFTITFDEPCEVQCDPTPGMVDTNPQFLCAGELAQSSTMGTQLDDNGEIFAFILHDGTADMIGSVLDYNTTGTFDISGLTPYTTYYITAVVGPDEDGNDLPDFNSVCTAFAEGSTPVTIGTPMLVSHVAVCDETGEDVSTTYSVQISVDGGYGAPYSAIINGEQVAFESTYLAGPFAVGVPYSIELADAQGCGETVTGNVSDCGPLPIELLSFDGEVLNEGNLLKWVTATEFENDFFTLYRSTDGYTYEEITIVDGAGTSDVVNNYDFLDKFAPTGLSYYRLDQTDWDGTTTSSNIITLVRGEISFVISQVYPVPTQNYLDVIFTNDRAEMLTWQTFSADGRMLATDKLMVSNGSNELNLDVANYPAGLYFIVLDNGRSRVTTKFAVEK